MIVGDESGSRGLRLRDRGERGQVHGDRRAAAGARLGAHVAPVRVDDALHDRQAEAGAAASLRSPEPLEHDVRILHREPRAPVADLESHA